MKVLPDSYYTNLGQKGSEAWLHFLPEVMFETAENHDGLGGGFEVAHAVWIDEDREKGGGEVRVRVILGGCYGKHIFNYDIHDDAGTLINEGGWEGDYVCMNQHLDWALPCWFFSRLRSIEAGRNDSIVTSLMAGAL